MQTQNQKRNIITRHICEANSGSDREVHTYPGRSLTQISACRCLLQVYNIKTKCVKSSADDDDDDDD